MGLVYAAMAAAGYAPTTVAGVVLVGYWGPAIGALLTRLLLPWWAVAREAFASLRNDTWYKEVFNRGLLALSGATYAWAYQRVAGAEPDGLQTLLGVGVGLYLTLPAGQVAIHLARWLSDPRGAPRLPREVTLRLPMTFMVWPVAAVAGQAYRALPWGAEALLMLLGPSLVALHALGRQGNPARLEEISQRLGALAEHALHYPEGYARRLQDLAYEVARRMGVLEPEAVRHAAALLLAGYAGLEAPTQTAPLSSQDQRSLAAGPEWGGRLADLLGYPPNVATIVQHARSAPDRPRAPLEAHALHVAYVYLALVTPRPYRETAYSPAQALRLLHEEEGLRYHPKALRALREALEPHLEERPAAL